MCALRRRDSTPGAAGPCLVQERDPRWIRQASADDPACHPGARDAQPVSGGFAVSRRCPGARDAQPAPGGFAVSRRPGARGAQPAPGGFAVSPETAEASAGPRRTADSSAPTTRKNSPAGKVQLHPAPPAGLNPTGVTNGPGVRRPRAENPRQRSGNETAPGGPRDERLNSTTISPGEQMRLA